MILASCTGGASETGDSATSGGSTAARPGVSDVPEAGFPERHVRSFHRADVEETFEAVARGVRFDPYTGILRGAAGTAMAGSGNSIDQAALLKEALGDQVTAVRFARIHEDLALLERGA